jgi:hypothetical protein
MLGGEKLFDPASPKRRQPDTYDYGVTEASQPQGNLMLPRNEETERQMADFIEAIRRLTARKQGPRI